jgi:hypothetical protein
MTLAEGALVAAFVGTLVDDYHRGSLGWSS